RRYSIIEVFYSDAGINFRRQVTSKYSVKYFTLLDYFHSTAEVQLLFILTAICAFLLIIGFYTRIFQFLTAVGLISIHNAAVILENGGDMAFNNYLVWGLFLPLGTSWSIDSIRKSIKKYPEYDSNDLNHPFEHKSTQIFHFAYIACMVQLAMIYFYNNINKTGAMWVDDATALHYMYQLETFLTPIGEFIASIIPIWAVKFLTHMTLWIEICAPIAILSPLFQPWLRRVVLILFIPFHFIILISVNIGLFSYVMFAALILLISKQDIEYLKRLLSRCCTRKYTVFYDRDCGFCHLTARVLKRMDVFSRLQWADRLLEGDKPENVDKLLERTIVVWDPKTGEIWTRHRGFSKILSAIPMGFLISWIFKIPILEKLFGYIYDFISNNRTSISKMTGQPACGINQGEHTPSIEREDHALFVRGRKLIWMISNILVLSLLIGAVDYSTKINDGLQKRFSKEEKKLKKSAQSEKFQSPRNAMKRILLYPRMYQKWNMFSPKVITYENWLMADITFENGETLSLFRGSDDIENRFEREYFTPYNNQFWRKLFGRLGKTSYERYIPKFKKWLMETEYFSEYGNRKVIDVKLWKLSEKSLDIDSPVDKRPKVSKRELKKKDRSARKSRKSSPEKNQNNRSYKKPKIK
ncbi:MAG: DCC1-like thiol-disulfide oxidoreductase family protein, partial [Candidatus Marinimicrobia bacterium]|nr:DCC1-like thiol-disulfide oxidoreductase family protein [Candidatus Neomarinimicrobiota bacterium]